MNKTELQEYRNLAAGVLKAALQVAMPEFPTPANRVFAGEARAIDAISRWTVKVRAAALLAGSLTGIIAKLCSCAGVIDDEASRLELFAEAEALLRKENYPIARKAYDAARIAQAVKEGFKA